MQLIFVENKECLQQNHNQINKKPDSKNEGKATRWHSFYTF